jgi:hypothetical protein
VNRDTGNISKLGLFEGTWIGHVKPASCIYKYGKNDMLSGGLDGLIKLWNPEHQRN